MYFTYFYQHKIIDEYGKNFKCSKCLILKICIFELDPNLGEDGIFTTTLTLTGQKITVTLIDFPGQEGN